MWSKDISTVKSNLYGGDSFLKGRPNFTEEAHSTEKAHSYRGDSAWKRRLSSTEETYPYEGHSLLRRLISTKEAHFYAGDWFSQRTLILTGVTHFRRGHIFFTEETHSHESTRFCGVDSYKRRRLMNELPEIESLCLRKDFWHRYRANIATR